MHGGESLRDSMGNISVLLMSYELTYLTFKRYYLRCVNAAEDLG